MDFRSVILKKDGAKKALCSIVSTSPGDIYEVKRSPRHLLAAIENNLLRRNELFTFKVLSPKTHFELAFI